MKIELNETEQRIVKFLALERRKYDARIGAHKTLYGNMDESKNEIHSYGAEMAFCKLNNCYPDFDPTHFEVFDARIKTGETVDVKYTSLRDGRLLIKMKEYKLLPDMFVLMIGEFPRYRLVGYIPSKDAILENRIDHTLKYPAYAIRQNELFEWNLVKYPSLKNT